MKKFICLFLILIAGIISCDGRKSNQEALTDSITEFKKNNTIEVVDFIPESYRVISTDTTLSNGFDIKIKTFTDMNDSIVKQDIKDSISYSTKHRVINTFLSVNYKDHLVFEEIIDKAFLLNKNTINKDYFSIANLKGVWINQYQSLKSNQAVLDVHLCLIESNDCKVYKLTINQEGNYKVINREKEIF